MNIRRKRIRNLKRAGAFGTTVYHMERDVGQRSYRNSIAFTGTEMRQRAYVARRVLAARRELRETIHRERTA